MGLDVYVGTLSRYFAGSWETVVQQQAAADGVPFAVIRVGEGGTAAASNEIPGVSIDPADTPPLSQDAVAQAIGLWRAILNAEFASVLPAPLDWDESAEAPYFTNKPAWDPYGALLLLAVHDGLAQEAERRGRQSRWWGLGGHAAEPPYPERAVANWYEDPVWVKASAANFPGSPYLHLLTAEMWLPCEFTRVLPMEIPSGQEILVGSSVVLLEELRALNDRTLRGTMDELQEWARTGAVYEDLFTTSAQFALGLMYRLTDLAVSHRLPMKLDY